MGYWAIPFRVPGSPRSIKAIVTSGPWRKSTWFFGNRSCQVDLEAEAIQKQLSAGRRELRTLQKIVQPPALMTLPFQTCFLKTPWFVSQGIKLVGLLVVRAIKNITTPETSNCNISEITIYPIFSKHFQNTLNQYVVQVEAGLRSSRRPVSRFFERQNWGFERGSQFSKRH